MNLQFTPFGLIIYILYAILIVMVVVLPLRLWLLKNKSWKWWGISVVAIPLLAAPILEEVWIAYHFEKLCQDAGVHVYRKVEADGYINDTRRASSAGLHVGLLYSDSRSLAEFDRKGFRYIEHMLRDGRVWHVVRREGGVYGQILDKPEARYYYKRSYQPTPSKYEEPVGWKLEKMESVVIDSENGEIIAREVGFKRRPSIIEGLWMGFVGSGLTICERPLDDHKKKTLTGFLPDHVFIPVTSENR